MCSWLTPRMRRNLRTTVNYTWIYALIVQGCIFLITHKGMNALYKLALSKKGIH